MAEEHAEESRTEPEDSNGHHLRRTAVIAAASGVTAYAAGKALSGRSSGRGENGSRRKDRSEGGGSLLTTAVATGWDVAKESLMPVVEDTAARAGELVAERAPELVRDIVMPRFIVGFERARRKSKSGEGSED